MSEPLKLYLSQVQIDAVGLDWLHKQYPAVEIIVTQELPTNKRKG